MPLGFVIWTLALSIPCVAQDEVESHLQTGPSQPSVILVSNISPGSFLIAPHNSPSSLMAKDIARMASQRSGAADLLKLDAQARKYSGTVRGSNEASEHIMGQVQSATAYRLRQITASSAVKLHYGIIACLRANDLFDESERLFQRQVEVQTQLIAKGIAIPDDQRLNRLRTVLEDKRYENQSKLALLRTELSGLIGPENACSYAPSDSMSIDPSDSHVCERIEQAIQCRCDLRTMRNLRSSIRVETLNAWDNYGAMLSGVPAPIKRRLFLTSVLRDHLYRDELECAVSTRQQWLDSLIAERTKLISQEVETAFEKKKTAALRWANATKQLHEWEQRIEQLTRLAEAHGNMAEQLEAKMNRLETLGQQLERWLDWQHAECDLRLAVGCDVF